MKLREIDRHRAEACLKDAIMICAIALLPVLVIITCHPDRPQWRIDPPSGSHVTMAQTKLWGKDILWVDARTLIEYESGHIDNAFPLNQDKWDSQISSVLKSWHPDLRVVVYSAPSELYAAREVHDRLKKYLPERSYLLRGGWEKR